MPDMILYETLETPVRWRSAVPGYILTAGVNNKLRLRIQHDPLSGDGVRIPGGSLIITMRRMGKIAEVVVNFGETFVPADAEYVDLSLPLKKSIRRGYYRLHVIHRDNNGEDTAVYNAWVVVDQTTAPVNDNHLEVNSVRTQFADLCADDHELLDGLEVGVGDIAEAVERSLQQWDSTPPRTSKYYGDNFPYTEMLRNGVMSMLLQSICTCLDRNMQTYQAEGVAVNLEARSQHYKQLRQEYITLWRSGMMQAKNEENVRCFNGGLAYV